MMLMKHIILSLKKFLGHPAANYSDPAKNKHCTEFEVNLYVVSEFILEKVIPVVGVHPYPLNELLLMVSSVCWFKPTHIFEWGTHVGKSARIFYETCRSFSLPVEIHSTDLLDNVDHCEHPHRNRGIMVQGLPGVYLYQGDGLDTSMKKYREFVQRGVVCRPFFYIDGDHEYQSVKRELLGVLQEIPDAAVLLHDTFYQSAGSGYNIGPYRAIQDVLSLLPDQYKVISTHEGLPGMTFLYRPGGDRV